MGILTFLSILVKTMLQYLNSYKIIPRKHHERKTQIEKDSPFEKRKPKNLKTRPRRSMTRGTHQQLLKLLKTRLAVY